jgi:uncharacterized repeat protein (TIGR01451 family)
MRGRRYFFSLLAVLAFTRFAYAGAVTVTSFAESGPGTLADAINQSNSGACTSPCLITFASGGTITIASSFLPAITAANVTIDGYTSTGAAANTNPFGQANNAVIRVALQGPGSGTGIAIAATGTGATVRGLAIGGFDTGISAGGATAQIQGNFIGTDTTGNNQISNLTGVRVGAAGVLVGGNDANRNLISGNAENGVVLDTGASGATVEGNYIGTRADILTSVTLGSGAGVQILAGTGHLIGTVGRPNLINSFSTGVEINTDGNSVKGNRIGGSADGTLATGGSTAGIYVAGNSNTIGGILAGEANQISGNVLGGTIAGNSNVFRGNLVGTDPTGTFNVGNFNEGLDVSGSSNTIDNNVIKFNIQGVIVDFNGIGNTILGNTIANNSSIAIDLRSGFDSGPTPNDPGDVDPNFFGGGNNLQNFPDVHSATLSGGTLTVNASLDSSGVPTTLSVRVQTFNAATGALLDSRCVAGNEFGPMAFTIPAAPVVLGDTVVMTATSYADGACTTVNDGTSEVSFPEATVAAPLVVTNTNDSGPGSLRQAITDANACSGPCNIVFNIPAPWPPVIQPLSQLPAITTDGTIVDGGTQTIFSSDANPNGPDVILDGTAAGAGANGFTIDASNAAVRGFVIRRFNSAGIAVMNLTTNRNENLIAGNYIGIDADGASAAGNGTGILLADRAKTTFVGGTTLHDRNVISGNSGDGIRITSATASGNLVAGNYIGTDAAGAAAVPNNRGVAIDTGAANNHIGSFGFILRGIESVKDERRASGKRSLEPKALTEPRASSRMAVKAAVCGCTPTPSNVISGNTVAGVAIANAGGGGGGPIDAAGVLPIVPSGLFLTAFPNTVTSNFIGTDATGDSGIANGVGVQVSGTTISALIGDASGFFANLIGFNTGAGVTVCSGATGVNIRGNDIFDNGGLGIDLNCDGVTPNDPLDADAGPNDLTNFPVIIATGLVDGAAVIHAKPSTGYGIDVYANTAADPSGHGEGEFFLGTADVFTDANGDGYFSFPTGLPPGTWVTLTATDNNFFDPPTSEFSAAVQVFSTPGTTAAVIDTAAKTIPAHVYAGGDAPQAVAWNGTTAIVALQGSKLVRLDMSKTPPPITDTLTLGASALKNVAVNPAGTQALVTAQDDQVYLVSLTTNPMTLLGTATLPSPDADGIAFYAGGAKALVADGPNLVVLDLTTPSSIGVTAIPISIWNAVDVAVNPAGTRAAVTINGGIQLYDLTTATPTFLGEDNTIAGDARGVVITSDGTKALFVETGRVGENSPRLFVFDITGSAPVSVSSLQLPDWVPTAVRLLPSGTAVIASRFGVFFVDPPYTAITTILTDAPQYSGSATDSLDVNAAGTKALNLNVDTPNLLPDASCTASLAFGSVNVGSSSTLTVNCTNTGATTLTVNSIGVTGGGFSLGTAPATPFAVDAAGTFNYQVTFTPTGAGVFTGTATVNNNGASGNADTALSGTGVQQADVSVSKSGPASFTPGQNIVYTITIHNAGPASATGVVVNDPTPSGLNFVSNTGACAGGYPCTLGTLAPLQTVVITTTFFVPPSYASPTIDNTASVTSTSTDSNATNDSTTVTSGGASNANVGISKSGPATVTAGQNITYTITVTNTGPSDAAGVSVSDTPAGINFVSNSGDCTTSFPCALGTVPAGQTRTITATFNVPLTSPSSVSNTATVSASTPDSSSSNNTSSVTTTVNPANADLSITKSGPASVVAGQNISYTIAVTNNGPGPATGVSVGDTPAGVNFVSNSGDCTTPFPCALGSIPSGQTRTITSVFNVPLTSPSSVSNTATVSASTPDASSSNNTSSVTTTVNPANADLAITKSGPASVVVGQNITYTLVVTNNGPGPANGVTVSDPTPAGINFGSNSGDCTTPFPCALGSIGAGQTRTITTVFNVPAGYNSPTITNTASVSATTPDAPTGNNSSSVNTTVTQSGADVAVSKSGPANAAPGSVVSYTIVVVNNGPGDATGVVLNDPTPSGLTFNSASGGGCTSFPCTIGPLPSGQNRTVLASYTVNGAGGSVINAASVTSSSADPNGSNNSASVTTITACPDPPSILQPATGAAGVPTSGNLVWSNTGASQYKVYFGPGGGGCQTLVVTTSATSIAYTALDPGTQYQWRVEAVSPGCPVKTSSCATFTTTAVCPAPPVLLAPANGTQAPSPVTLSWSAVAGAASYTVFASVNGGPSTNLGTTAQTFMSVTLDDGPVSWFVTADAGPQCPLRSATGTFNMCNPPIAPIALAVAEIQTGQTYAIEWDDMNAPRYEVDESASPSFPSTSTTTTSTTLTSISFRHTASAATGWYYRVRAFSVCANAFGPNSDVVRVVVAPVPPPDDPNANAPLGSTQPVTLQVFIPGFPEGNVPFTARVDKPWATVAPAAGILPPGGILLTITADPTGLPAGTWEATVIVTIGGPSSASRIKPLAETTTIKIPVSISIVTPVGSAKSTEPPANAMIIPTAGHLGGIASKWQSDVRLANTGFAKTKYQITFAPAGADASKNMKQTTIEVDAGRSAALNDIVRNWYGIGSLGESANGVLEIRPLGGAKALDLGTSPITVQTVSVASSRTYNVTAQGTLGQFIPAITFSSFITKAATSGITPILGLQQIAQSSAFRTNLGVVEGGGKPANVLISVFDLQGKNLLNFPLELAANEQKQLNGFLASQNVAVPDGRIEVKVTSGDGKVTAYASVIDNASGDPLLVDGVPLHGQGSDHYVVPGVAALSTGFANWQSDVRIYNAGTGPQTATFTYYPQNAAGAPQVATMTIDGGETKALDNALQTLFALTNGGGALHVSTPSPSNLVVSARTYNKTTNGTYGQFIPAVTEANALGAGEGALQILQVEESVRYRTNLGVANVNGKPSEVEISIFNPELKVAAKTQFTLAPNEFRQFNVLREIGMDDTYNARIQVRVLSGEGKIAAYGSVVDMQTQDPTFVPAQLSQ